MLAYHYLLIITADAEWHRNNEKEDFSAFPRNANIIFAIESEIFYQKYH